MGASCNSPKRGKSNPIQPHFKVRLLLIESFVIFVIIGSLLTILASLLFTDKSVNTFPHAFVFIYLSFSFHQKKMLAMMWCTLERTISCCVLYEGRDTDTVWTVWQIFPCFYLLHLNHHFKFDVLQ